MTYRVIFYKNQTHKLSEDFDNKKRARAWRDLVKRNGYTFEKIELIGEKK